VSNKFQDGKAADSEDVSLRVKCLDDEEFGVDMADNITVIYNNSSVVLTVLEVINHDHSGYFAIITNIILCVFVQTLDRCTILLDTKQLTPLDKKINLFDAIINSIKNTEKVAIKKVLLLQYRYVLLMHASYDINVYSHYRVMLE
jgi:hypothetical protein